jgi:pilus assembly protein CpaB
MIFFGAVGLALLAAVLVFAALANFGGGDDTASGADLVDVIVASQDIDAGDTISADMVELASLPPGTLVDGAFTDQAAVVGTKAQVRMLRGDQLAPQKIVGAGAECKGVTCILPDGRVGFAVAVTQETGGGGNILPGDHVDVISVADDPGTDLTRGTLLLQNIEVVAVAQTTLKAISTTDENGEPIESDTSEGAISTRDRNADEEPDAETIMVAVATEDAVLLAVAQEVGTVYLVPRPLGDDSVVDGEVERTLQ